MDREKRKQVLHILLLGQINTLIKMPIHIRHILLCNQVPTREENFIFAQKREGDFVVRNSIYAREIALQGIDAGDPILTGIGLHILQDSYSHEGYESYYGHARDNHLPDDPSRDIDKAMEMAKETYEILKAYLWKNYEANPLSDWDELYRPIYEKFKEGEIFQRQNASWWTWANGLSDEWSERNRVNTWAKYISINGPYKYEYWPRDSWVDAFEHSASLVWLPR
jgi:hypothetical protein